MFGDVPECSMFLVSLTALLTHRFINIISSFAQTHTYKTTKAWTKRYRELSSYHSRLWWSVKNVIHVLYVFFFFPSSFFLHKAERVFRRLKRLVFYAEKGLCFDEIKEIIIVWTQGKTEKEIYKFTWFCSTDENPNLEDVRSLVLLQMSLSRQPWNKTCNLLNLCILRHLMYCNSSYFRHDKFSDVMQASSPKQQWKVIAECKLSPKFKLNWNLTPTLNLLYQHHEREKEYYNGQTFVNNKINL